MKHVGLSDFERSVYRPADGFLPERVRDVAIKGESYRNPFWLVPEHQLIYPCIEGVSVSKMHGARPIGRCGKATCYSCGELWKTRFIGELMHLRQEHDGLPVFSVLTFVSRNGKALGKSGKPINLDTCKKYAARWRKAASKILKTDVYVQVPEWHKSGVVHFNVVWFGVDRGFMSCPIKNARGEDDMRLTCRMCQACSMRSAWTAISGAPRSTHEIASQGVAKYVAKYLTKDTIQQTWKPSEAGMMKRASFSRSCRRTPAIYPVYRWIGQTLRDNDAWYWGKKTHEADKRFQDYLTDEGLFLQDESSYKRFSIENPDGKWLKRSSCSEAHRGLCDRVPYFSPTKQAAWDGRHWEWFRRQFGNDTYEMIHQKIFKAWEFIMPRLETTDGYN